MIKVCYGLLKFVNCMCLFFAITGPHGAMWIMTHNEIITINKSCNFLSQLYGKDWNAQGFVREYMSSLSIYRNTRFVRAPLNCMVAKIIPVQ